MQRIGILGGTFDPVHVEHINLIKNVIKELDLSKLIIVPTFLPPHKIHSECALPDDRKKMLEIAVNNNNINAEISDYEISEGGKSFSYKTVTHFKEIYSEAELFFIVGGDMLVDFKTWKEPAIILSKATLAVFDREGLNVDYEYEKRYFREKFNTEFIRLKYIGKNLSSTKIRIYNMFCLPIDSFTDIKVAQYIIENNLYIGNEISDIVRISLPLKRLTHTAEVVICALKKSKELNLSREDIFTACALHDVCKYKNESEFPKGILPDNMPAPVKHAYLGEYFARNTIGIKNQDILNAIKYHTSGRAGMSNLEKLVFVADMIEDGRDYEGVENLRKIYDRDFNECFLACLKEEMQHLENKTQNIFIETINAYNYYIAEEK